MWITKAIFVPTKRICERDLTNSLGLNLTQDILSLSHVPQERAPCATWNRRHSSLTDTLACENGLDGLHASRSTITACVGTRSARTLTRVLTRTTELVLHKKRKWQDHRSARSDGNHLKICVMAKGKGPKEAFLNLSCWRKCLGRSGLALWVSCPCSRSVLPLWKGWMGSKRSTVHMIAYTAAWLRALWLLLVLLCWGVR